MVRSEVQGYLGIPKQGRLAYLDEELVVDKWDTVIKRLVAGITQVQLSNYAEDVLQSCVVQHGSHEPQVGH